MSSCSMPQLHNTNMHGEEPPMSVEALWNHGQCWVCTCSLHDEPISRMTQHEDSQKVDDDVSIRVTSI